MMKSIKKLIVVLLMILMGVALFACAPSGEKEEPETFSIRYSATTGGTIFGKTEQSINSGKDASEVTAVSDEGYIFIQWSDGNKNPTRQDKNITEALTFSANFVINYKMVTYITVNGYFESNSLQTVIYGKDAKEVTVFPHPGHEFVEWSDGNTNPTRQDKNITEDTTFIAYFKKTVYKIQCYAGEGGRLEGESYQELMYDQIITPITVFSNPGYLFVKWSNGNKNTTISGKPTESLNITAEFRKLYDGGGTLENPYIVATYAQLQDMVFYPDSHFKLTQNLDLDKKNHIPLFDDDKRFKGIFDGGDYTIANMTVNNMEINQFTPFPSLFGFIDTTGEVKNLVITNFSIAVPNYNSAITPLNVGAVCGVSLGKLTNISVQGEIIAQKLEYPGACIGGVVGQTHNLIENCHANVAITLNNVAITPNTVATGNAFYSLCVGGVAGITAQDVLYCTSIGVIDVFSSATNTCEIFIGGIAGTSFDVCIVTEINFTDCFSDVEINSSSATIGGMLGFVSNKLHYNFSNCYALGDITNGVNGGGLFGRLRIGTGNITDCYASGNVNVKESAGGFAAFINTALTIQVSNCYATGNVSGTYAGGFSEKATGVNFFQVYAIGNSTGTEDSGGFAVDIRGNVEECFSTGNVTGYYFTAGFAISVTGYAKNCYSTSDLFIACTDPSIGDAAGLIMYASDLTVSCYYSGKIKGNKNYNNENIGGLFSYISFNHYVINCHWVKYSDSLAINGKGYPYDDHDGIEIITHTDITELYALADILNANSPTSVWININGNTPQLKFMV